MKDHIVGLKVEKRQFGQDPDVFDEEEQKHINELQEEFKVCLKEILHMKRQRLLAKNYNEALLRMEKDLGNLDKQVTKLTAGDLRVAKKRDGKIKFDPRRDPRQLD